MKKLFFFLLVCHSCTPKVVVQMFDETTVYPKTEFYAPFALIESDTIDFSKETIIADVHAKGNTLTIHCDYETVRRLTEDKAKNLGGNCLIITEHIKPDAMIKCHQVKGKVLKIAAPEKYETEILWHPNRPLKIENFKGGVEKRPFQAATYSMIRYYGQSNPMNGESKVMVENIFKCYLSYFKLSDYDEEVLAHEQLHFDITEIYTRKFRKRIIDEISSYTKFLEEHEKIFQEIQEAWTLKQDEYDSEVYKDRSLQEKWTKWVSDELSKLEAYKSMEIQF